MSDVESAIAAGLKIGDDAVIDHLTVPARELISRGAEAIVIGCGLSNAWLSSLVTLNLLSEKYPNAVSVRMLKNN